MYTFKVLFTNQIVVINQIGNLCGVQSQGFLANMKSVHLSKVLQFVHVLPYLFWLIEIFILCI